MKPLHLAVLGVGAALLLRGASSSNQYPAPTPGTAPGTWVQDENGTVFEYYDGYVPGDGVNEVPITDQMNLRQRYDALLTMGYANLPGLPDWAKVPLYKASAELMGTYWADLGRGMPTSQGLSYDTFENYVQKALGAVSSPERGYNPFSPGEGYIVAPGAAYTVPNPWLPSDAWYDVTVSALSPEVRGWLGL